MPMTGEYDPHDDDSQAVEMSGPDNDRFYSSNLLDWVPLCPQLKDSAVRLYWIMRALVIEKHGPVRKLTILQLCYLLPAKPAAPGEPVKPSSRSRVRSLLDDLTKVGLVTTPDGKQIKTSSRASASGALRLRINDRPFPGYTGPRNAFGLLDAVRDAAAEASAKAIKEEAARAAARKAERAAEAAGQISGPQVAPESAGQISDPAGQISDPAGQISDLDSGSDLQDHDLPFSPPVQSPRTPPTSVRPSVSVGEGARESTDGGTDGGGVIEEQEQGAPTAGDGVGTAAAGAAPGKDAATGEGPRAGGVVPVERTPGVATLQAVAAVAPQWTITEAAALRDQGAVASRMLENGFTPQEIQHALLSRPLPHPLTHTVGAVVAGRLRDLIAAGPASAAAPIAPWVPGQAGPTAGQPPTPTPLPIEERRAQLEAAVRGAAVHRNCEGEPDGAYCDRLALPGEVLCARCLHGHDRMCAAGCGRAVVTPGAQCIKCANAPDQLCPGHDGPCGRPAVTDTGLCFKCEWARAEAQRAGDDDLAAVLAAAVAAAEAEGATNAPF
ncbi:hypothetical protein [Streptomyces liangshanensis]|uniref:hypothetical protein n=1 Tax=Streptomyces liangshanensis TaxID=2717324 RepID=UPI0036DBF6D6